MAVRELLLWPSILHGLVPEVCEARNPATYHHQQNVDPNYERHAKAIPLVFG